jgi:transcription termination factor Rho
MPVKKTTRAKKTKLGSDNSDVIAPEESQSEEVASASNAEKVVEREPEQTPGRQLFFSTDGTDPDEENISAGEVEKTQSKEAAHVEPSIKSGEIQADPTPDESPSNAPDGSRKPHNPSQGGNNQGHPQGQKKLTWQEKKKLRRKQKFKKPRRLPYEETEAKPLEIGQLLEADVLKSEEDVSSLLQPLIDSGKDFLNLDDFLSLNLLDLIEKVKGLELEEDLPASPLREELIDLLMDSSLEAETPVLLSGIIQVMEDGHGFILQQREDYRLKSQSAFVPECLVRKFGLKTGHAVKGIIRAKMEESSCPVLLRVDKVMGLDPEEATRVTPFTELTPYYPLRRMYLETHQKVEWDNVAMRVVDLVSPVGFGQRGLIVAPPRTGKTILQQGIARALRQNNPDAHLIVLLVDERPEEVTDFRRQVPDAEVIASTFDESAESHVHAAEIVIEKARRMVEHQQHVVILLDSITRLARAYNTTMPNSGKILSGGVEATALQRPKRFFGSARNIEGGGSLTILGTALVETGSKMDEVIFEEFKGTGNMELHLDRELSNKRIFPALDFEKSGTRKEELLYHPDELSKIYALRRSMKGVPPAEAMEMFIQRVKKTKNNPEFLMGLGR